MRARAIRTRGGETRFAVLSRGDRVRGRLAAAGAPDAPLLVVAPPDGEASGALAGALLEAWSPFAHVAVLDLPLCGSRRSDKLSALVLGDSEGAVARVLRADLERQLRSDVERTAAALGAQLGVAPERTCAVLLGLAARWAGGLVGAAPFPLVVEPTLPAELAPLTARVRAALASV